MQNSREKRKKEKNWCSERAQNFPVEDISLVLAKVKDCTVRIAKEETTNKKLAKGANGFGWGHLRNLKDINLHLKCVYIAGCNWWWVEGWCDLWFRYYVYLFLFLDWNSFCFSGSKKKFFSYIDSIRCFRLGNSIIIRFAFVFH